MNQPPKSMNKQECYCLRNMSDPRTVVEHLTNTWKIIDLFLLNTRDVRNELLIVL